jgi:hypothetical protein
MLIDLQASGIINGQRHGGMDNHTLTGERPKMAARARSPNPLLGESCGQPARFYSPGRGSYAMRKALSPTAHDADAFMMPSERSDPHAVWRKDMHRAESPHFPAKSMAFTALRQNPKRKGCSPAPAHTLSPPTPEPADPPGTVQIPIPPGVGGGRALTPRFTPAAGRRSGSRPTRRFSTGCRCTGRTARPPADPPPAPQRGGGRMSAAGRTTCTGPCPPASWTPRS